MRQRSSRLIAAETGSVFSVATVRVAMGRELATLLGKKSEEAFSADAGRFDGKWDVLIACSSQGGGLEYNLQVPATVKDGVLQGQYGTDGVGPCLTLEGKINADGSALLTARGLTGDPKFSIRNARKGMAYFYHIDAKFSGNRGKGHRVENRVCDIDFIKH